MTIGFNAQLRPEVKPLQHDCAAPHASGKPQDGRHANWNK